MPSRPMTNLVVGKTSFALRTFDTLFDALFGFGHTRKLRQPGIRMRVRQIVVRLNRFILSIAVPNHDKYFLMTFLSLVSARNYASFYRLNYQRSFRSVTDVNLCPLILPLFFDPFVDACPRRALSGQVRLLAADRRAVGGHAQDESLPSSWRSKRV